MSAITDRLVYFLRVNNHTVETLPAGTLAKDLHAHDRYRNLCAHNTADDISLVAGIGVGLTAHNETIAHRPRPTLKGVPR